MSQSVGAGVPAERPSLLIRTPAGMENRAELSVLPFRIGRQGDNDLVLRDTRISRRHAQIVADGSGFRIEDLGSSHGVWVNGERVTGHLLRHGDEVEFGSPDGYRLRFESPLGALERAMSGVALGDNPALPRAANLSKLRAIMEVARALQSAVSMEDVFSTLVDAALAVTGAERGFLLLRKKDDLEIVVARDAAGHPLKDADLRVPTSLIRRALQNRRDLLTMNFDPLAESGMLPSQTAVALELRSVMCVPLVKIRAGNANETTALASVDDTQGLLYLDSRADRADLSAGNRELLATLALEASTVLENARLLEGQRERQRMEEELKIARSIQQSLLPRQLPSGGWFEAAGLSIPSYQVGGDYFDVRKVDTGYWAAVVADVSGKGVSSALLAALLQGVFLAGVAAPEDLSAGFKRLNRFLIERTGGEKYATVFYALFAADGTFHYVNAGHTAPYVIRPDKSFLSLPSGNMALGWFEDAEFDTASMPLQPGSRLVVVSDGVTEARDPAGKFYGDKRLENLIRGRIHSGPRDLADAIRLDVEIFASGAVQRDDLTVLVCHYRGDPERTKG